MSAHLSLDAVGACSSLWTASYNLLDIYRLPGERETLEELFAGGR